MIAEPTSREVDSDYPSFGREFDVAAAKARECNFCKKEAELAVVEGPRSKTTFYCDCHRPEVSG